jgi:Putative prokaryotic signal transducing protein
MPASTPSKRAGQHEGLIPVLSCASPEEAATLRGVLESHGVPCVIQGEHHRSLLGMLGPYVEVRLLVPAAHEEAARRLLRPAPAAVPDPEDLPDPERARRRRRLAWVAMLILGGPTLVASALALLARCG